MLCYFGFLYYLKINGRLNEETALYMMLLLGILLRCFYVVLSGLYDRQHDAGAYTGMGTDFINPGHIGYIEYIYKFHRLPDINPYELFAYYHPPLHHIISCLFLMLNVALGVTEELAFENLQILPLLYSCLCMVVTLKILRLLGAEKKGLLLGLSLVVFHPATIVMAGSVNNDMLTMLFMCLTILGTLQWIRNRSLSNLIKLALYIGFGMITKLNSAVLAIPLGLLFLFDFIGICRRKVKSEINKSFKNYLIFALLVCPIGLSWIVRNLVRFSEKPGVPVPGETSPMYTQTFSLWQRLGIPAWSQWHFDFPFHPISAKAIHNTWVIMFQTSLFAEEYPTTLPDVLLALCQLVYVLSIILALLLSFGAFVIIYPYTCSSDFRYVTVALVFMSITIALSNKKAKDSCLRLGKSPYSVLVQISNFLLVAVLTLITIIYCFWNLF